MHPLLCMTGSPPDPTLADYGSDDDDHRIRSKEWLREYRQHIDIRNAKVTLLDGSASPAFESAVRKALDTCVPSLVSTPRLQDKALRSVFSIGIDMAIMDAELSARMGKLALHPRDLLTEDETDDLFGRFRV